MVVVGTRRGAVVVWDLATERVVARLGGKGGHAGAVRAVVGRKDGLFSAGSDGQVLFWSWDVVAASGSPLVVADEGFLGSFSSATFHAISAMATDASGSRLAVAANSIAVLDVSDLDSVSVLATLTGHATLVSTLAFSASGVVLLSAAVQDRYINVYDLASSSKDTVFSPDAARILLADASPLGLVVYGNGGEPGGKGSSGSGVGKKRGRKSKGKGGDDNEEKEIHAAAFTARGKCLVWKSVMVVGSGDDDAGSDNGSGPSSGASSSSSSSKGKGKGKGKAKSKAARRARSRAVKPQGATCVVEVESSEGNEGGNANGRGIRGMRSTTTEVGRGEDHGFLIMHGPPKAPAFERVVVKGGETDVKISPVESQMVKPSVGGSSTFSSAGGRRDVNKVQTLGAADALATLPEESMGGADSLSDEDGEEEEGTGKVEWGGLSFAERLRALDKGSGRKEDSDGESERDSVAPKGESLKRMLVQALHSNDSQLLEYCLGMSAAGTITATVRQLPTSRVVSLLRILTEKLRSRPARAQTLLPWLRAILVTHTAFLLSVPGLSTMLKPLYQTFQERLSVYDKLMTLNGRLDLVLSQVSVYDDDQGARRASRSKPRTVYMEGDDDNGLEFGMSSSSDDESSTSGDSESDSDTDDSEDVGSMSE